MNDQEKFATVQRLKLCYNCIRGGHTIPTCQSKVTCFVTGCGEKHHTSLHKSLCKETPTPEPEAEVKSEGVEDAGSAKSSTVSLLKSAPKEVFLLVVPVVVHHSGVLRKLSSKTCGCG